jgi:hypothetical protein
MFAIEAIKFNWDSTANSKDALNIRKNATEAIAVPEWKRFVNVNPEDSRAVYALASIHSNQITIEASLSSTDPGVAFVEVRVGHHVKSRPVNFINGQTGFLSFELSDAYSKRAAIGIYDAEWHWEYRIGPHHSWHHFATTRHRFYFVLKIPTAPWKQTPVSATNTQLLWTDVLDYTCRWAEGATSTDMAAAMITQNVYALGPAVVTYDCPGGGSSHYSLTTFDCTAFIEIAWRPWQWGIRQLQRLRDHCFNVCQFVRL